MSRRLVLSTFEEVYSVDFVEGGKPEYPKKNPQSQIEIDKSQPTCGAQDSIPGRRGGRREWWPLRQPESPASKDDEPSLGNHISKGCYALDSNTVHTAGRWVYYFSPASSWVADVCSVLLYIGSDVFSISLLATWQRRRDRPTTRTDDSDSFFTSCSNMASRQCAISSWMFASVKKGVTCWIICVYSLLNV